MSGSGRTPRDPSSAPEARERQHTPPLGTPPFGTSPVRDSFAAPDHPTVETSHPTDLEGATIEMSTRDIATRDIITRDAITRALPRPSPTANTEITARPRQHSQPQLRDNLPTPHDAVHMGKVELPGSGLPKVDFERPAAQRLMDLSPVIEANSKDRERQKRARIAVITMLATLALLLIVTGVMKIVRHGKEANQEEGRAPNAPVATNVAEEKQAVTPKAEVRAAQAAEAASAPSAASAPPSTSRESHPKNETAKRTTKPATGAAERNGLRNPSRESESKMKERTPSVPQVAEPGKRARAVPANNDPETQTEAVVRSLRF